MKVAVGTDIEHIRNFAPSTWEAFLTSAEKRIIANAPAGKRAHLRTLSWSLKESVLKALGVGLRMHPRHVDISRLLVRESSVSNTIEIQGVLYSAEVRSWRMGRNFVATVVALPHV